MNNQITSLSLRNFRNYRDVHFDFSDPMQIFLGPNGVGKTNLLEALCLLFSGRSFRTTSLHEMIHFHQESFNVEATFTKEPPFEEKISMTYIAGDKQKKILYNQSPVPSFNKLVGYVPVVTFTPEDIELIIGPPAYRRKFLNFFLSQKDPHYFYHYARYMKALRHKNALLRSQNLSLLEIFEEEMAKSACFIVQAREQLLMDLEKLARSFFSSFPIGKELSLTYRSTCKEKNFQQAWIANREAEFRYQNCLIGPHRDDFTILLDGKPVKNFASQGQKRSCLATIKLAEFSSLTSPIFLIDDFGVHLDENNSNAFLHHIEHSPSTFITAIQDRFPKKGKRKIIVSKQTLCRKKSGS